MANVFLNTADRDIETAIMLEQAIVHDIGNAVAYTDGNRVFINTEDNLFNILPAYNHGMLKWLLWHERYHKELRHHNRFFKYIEELKEEDLMDEFHVTKEEVNIIMDILVHDSLSKLFPELVETAVNNLAQMRNRNSLEYTFETFTLEEMLDEYKAHKHGDDKDDKEEGDEESKEGDKEKDEEGKTSSGKKGHKKGGDDSPKSKEESKPEDEEPEIKETPKPMIDEHDKTDWSKLEQIDSKEFITEEESYRIRQAVDQIKRMKLRLARITETLNGLVTSTRKRTYAKPSHIQLPGGAILKGSQPGRVQLYLCFDASGSMGSELETFKEIISKAVPQAMDCPCEWFTGHYGKGKFRDIMPVYATSGFDDDGDRTIDLCYKAEQKGYTPIGVTDGGGCISWSKDKLKSLQRTILVGQSESWLRRAKEINPRIQTLCI